MKIDGNNNLFKKVQETTEKKGANKKQDIKKSEAEKDKISLSGKAKELSELKAAISELPDIRTDKVDAVKKAVDAGTYDIDARKIAEKMLEEI